MEANKQYASLVAVLERALDQAVNGKGKERHANDDAFENQIMCYMAAQLGIGAPVFQVVKKSVEACRLPYPANVNELLGAIVYAAGAVIEIERKREADYREAEKVAEGVVNSLQNVAAILRAGANSEKFYNQQQDQEKMAQKQCQCGGCK